MCGYPPPAIQSVTLTPVAGIGGGDGSSGDGLGEGLASTGDGGGEGLQGAGYALPFRSFLEHLRRWNARLSPGTLLVRHLNYRPAMRRGILAVTFGC